MVDKLNIVEDIESEYKKLYNECKKKYTSIRDLIEGNLTKLTEIKSLNINQIEGELKKSVESLLKPIIQATESKYSKLYISCLCIAKKLVTYNLVKQSQTNTVIKILKDILDNSTEDYLQIKVIETLLPMVNPQVINLTEDLVNNVLQMCLKIFSLKNSNYKNPVSALFKQLMITVFGFLDGSLRPSILSKIEEVKKNQKSQNFNTTNLNQIAEPEGGETVIEEVKQIEKIPEVVSLVTRLQASDIDLSEFFNIQIYITSVSVFKNLVQILEGKKKEWIQPNVYSKVLALELLSGIIDQSGWVLSYLDEISHVVTDELIKIMSKMFETTNDYITGMKLSRLTSQIIEKMNLGYNLLPYILKYSESNQLWQKYIGLEVLSSLCSNPDVLKELYSLDGKNTYYSDLLNTLTKLSYSVVTTKVDLKSKSVLIKGGSFVSTNYLFPVHRLINTSSILTETEANINIQSSYPNSNIVYKFLFDAYMNLKDSFFKILECHGIRTNAPNSIDTPIKEKCKEMLIFNFENIKNAMTALFINSFDEVHCQGYLNMYLSYITLFGSLRFNYGRDSYLNDLCKLAIPNNLENSLEMKDKNVLISKTLFNIAHCNNILDFEAWSLLIETFQKIYLMLINSNNHMLKPSQEFEIDVIIKNLEATIKKYDPEYGVNQERTVLRADLAEDNHKDMRKSLVFETSQRKDSFSMATRESNANKPNASQTKSSDADKEENIDLAIISTALDSIFINSKNYDTKLVVDIAKALSSSTKTLIEENQSMNDNIITYLHFNLTKILEICVININRVPFFWEHVVNTVTCIASKNYSNISRFSMDCLTIINMFMLTQFDSTTFTSKYLDHANPEEIGSIQPFSVVWQQLIFEPFISITDALNHMNIFLNMVYNMGKILQNCGQYFDFNGWEFYFKVLASLVDKSDENLVEQSFKIVENINAEFTDFILIENVRSYSSLLETFSSNKKNANISYLAVSMFWSSSKIIEKFGKIASKLSVLDTAITEVGFYNLKKISEVRSEMYNDINQLTSFQTAFFVSGVKADRMQEYFDSEWLFLFDKLIGLSIDVRFEVRKASISTFADIFCNYCHIMSLETSRYIIQEIFFKVFSKLNFNYESKIKKYRMGKQAGQGVAANDGHVGAKLPKSNINNFVSSDEIQIGDFKANTLKLPGQK